MALAGNDGEGFDLIKGLRQTGVDTTYMARDDDIYTPTYTKTFFEYPDGMEETHRIDIKNRKPTPPRVEREIVRSLLELEDKVDAFVCLEQLENGSFGVFTEKVLETLADIGGRGKAKVFADSRFHIAGFKNAVVKCNDIEVLRATGMQAAGDMDRRSYFDLVERAMRRAEEQQTAYVCFVRQRRHQGASGKEIITVPAFTVEGRWTYAGRATLRWRG